MTYSVAGLTHELKHAFGWGARTDGLQPRSHGRGSLGTLFVYLGEPPDIWGNGLTGAAPRVLMKIAGRKSVNGTRPLWHLEIPRKWWS